MSKFDIEAIEYGLGFPIGTRFYFRNVPFEVVGSDDGDYCCPKCAFHKRNEKELCRLMYCFNRDQQKYIFFREVTEVGKI